MSSSFGIFIENISETIKGFWVMIFLLVLVVFLYRHYTKTFTFFKEKGIKYIEPTIFVGNLWSRLREQISNHDFYKNIYQHFDGSPYGGYFEGSSPRLMIRDPELIKTVCIKDFNFFQNRARDFRPGHPCDRKNLLFLKDDDWKHARSIISPSFTSGKLKGMETLIQRCGEQLINLLKSRPDPHKEIELKTFTGRYTLQNIAMCAFGLDSASIKDENSDFLKYVMYIFKGSILFRISFLMSLLFYPPLGKHIPMSKSSTMGYKYLMSVVDQVKADRENYKEKRRPDFLQLLLNYQEKERNEQSGDQFVDDQFIHGQSILFLLAGFETTSTLLSFACHALAVHPEIQERLRTDILKAFEENDGKCTYDMVNNIPYLEQVIFETLRLYPPVSRLERECHSKYTLPNTNVTLEPGDVVSIPVSGIMGDPEYYPKPWIFDPERFNPIEKSTRAKELFLAFGLGPRNCIGLRFSLMSAKFYLCYLLREFKLNPCSKTQYPITFDKKFLLLASEKGNWVKIEPLNKLEQIGNQTK